jgi:hypothetical protein
MIIGVATVHKTVRVVADLSPTLAQKLEDYCRDADRTQASAIRYALARLVREWEESRL